MFERFSTMFERFSTRPANVVIGAQVEARRSGTPGSAPSTSHAVASENPFRRLPRLGQHAQRAMNQQATKSRCITDGHILLGLIRDGDGLAMKVLHDRGVDPAGLPRGITAALAS